MAPNVTIQAVDKEFRHLSIHAELRRQIVDGHWQPGHRLPTRDELSSQFNASKITVQRALEQLISDGLVIARGRAGTFVVPRLPQLHTYGLVFSAPQRDNCWDWSPYFNGLVRQAAALSEAGRSGSTGVRIKVYYGIRDPWADTAPDGLAADLKQHRLSGLMVVRSQSGWQPSQPVNVPVVSIGVAGGVTSMSAGVEMPWHPWCQRALDLLVKSKAKRVALLNNAARSVTEIDALAVLAKSRGLTVKPQWIQGIYPDHPDWARRSVHLLVDRNSGEKPDALLITDDSLIGPASAGLVDASIRVPRDMCVVAWSNLPSTVPGILPIVRLGFDLRQVLLTGVSQIDHLRLRKKFEKVSSVPVVLEEEFLSQQHPPATVSA